MKLIGPINALFPYPLDVREIVDDMASLDALAHSNTAYDYMKVTVRENGYTYELQPGGSWVLFTAKGPKGDRGSDGRGLEFEWDGSRLGVRVEGERDYEYSDVGFSLSTDLTGVDTTARRLVPIINELHGQVVTLQNQVAGLVTRVGELEGEVANLKSAGQ